jgi:hypothetical protein
MPLVIKKIGGELLTHLEDFIPIINISSNVQTGDYINFENKIFFFQNYSNVTILSNQQRQLLYGLKNSYNLPIINLQISY